LFRQATIESICWEKILLILAIDTSARHFSLALLDDRNLIAKIDSRFYQTSGEQRPTAHSATASKGAVSTAPRVSATLFTAMSDLFDQTDFRLRDVESIVVAVGPGMFTGLRVGVVTAKTLAYVQKVPLLGVNTLEVIAAQTAISLEDAAVVIRPVINAQRQQLFGGAYRSVEPWRLKEVQPNEIQDRETWIASLREHDVVTGSGLRPLISRFQDGIATDQNIQIAAPATWDCSALGVGMVGRRYLLEGKHDDLWKLEPNYFRPSAAEEVFVAKQQNSAKS
jgi:tRNA threonylcarbamoyladenosine biosynthesis protein TsaB